MFRPALSCPVLPCHALFFSFSSYAVIHVLKQDFFNSFHARIFFQYPVSSRSISLLILALCFGIQICDVLIRIRTCVSVILDYSPDPDPALFFSGFQDAKKSFFAYCLRYEYYISLQR